MLEQWGLDLPRIILSVTGGAKSFDLPPLLDEMLRTGLSRAVRSNSVWIITGGTNSGVMRYVAEAAAQGGSGMSSPVIGVLPWAIVNRRDIMDRARGGDVYYGDPDRQQPAHLSLDQHHTHFVMVDDGRVGKFQGEIEVRSKLESALAKKFSQGEFGTPSPITSITIAIQGGPGTLKTCLSSLQQGHPLLVVQGSGMAADVIAYAYMVESNGADYTHEGLQRLIMNEFYFSRSDPKFQDILSLAEQCAAYHDLIYVYKVDFFGSGTQSFDVAILDCVLEHDRRRAISSDTAHWLSSMEGMSPGEWAKERKSRIDFDRVRKLELSLLWNRIDVAR